MTAVLRTDIVCRMCGETLFASGTHVGGERIDRLDEWDGSPVEIVMPGGSPKVIVRCDRCDILTDATAHAVRLKTRSVPTHPCPCGCGGTVVGGQRQVAVAYLDRPQKR